MNSLRHEGAGASQTGVSIAALVQVKAVTQGAFTRVRLAKLGLCMLALFSISAPAGAETEDEQVARRALEWLAAHFSAAPAKADGEYPNASADGKRLAALFVTGFLLQLHPEFREGNALRDLVREEARKFVRNPGMNSMQATWHYGFLALYYSEAKLRGAAVDDELSQIAQLIERTQNAEGGWGHGTMSLEFYPSTLMAATNWATFGLGMARRLGASVGDKALLNALELFRATQSKNGAFPYGGKNYRKGFEAGRTSGAVLALAAANSSSGEVFRRAASYAETHAEAIPSGHASGAMHVLTGALAFALLGDESWAVYERSVLGRVRDAQREGGSYRDLVENSPDSLEILGSAEANAAYITAFYAAAISAPRSKVVALLRLKKPRKESPEVTTVPSLPDERPAQRWSHVIANAVQFAAVGEHVLVADRDAGYWLFDANDGTQAPARFRSKGGFVPAALFLDETRAITLEVPPELAGPVLPVSVGDGLPKTQMKPGRIVLLRVPSLDVVWEAPLDGLPLGGGIVGKQFALYLRTGEVQFLGFDSGRTAGRIRVSPPIANGAFAIAEGGALAIASEAELSLFGPDRKSRWKKELTGQRGVNPAAFHDAVWWGDLLAVGTTAGAVQLRDGVRGEIKRKRDLEGGSVQALLVCGEHLIVLTADGVVHALNQGGESAWTYASPTLREEHETEASLFQSGRTLLVHSPGAGACIGLDPQTGKALFALPLARGTQVATAGGSIFALSNGTLTAYTIPAAKEE